MTYEYHPLANIFPLIEGQAYQELLGDVLKHGVREPVWLYEGKILDGRNRFRAATAMGKPVEFKQYEGSDAVGFVISLNLHRRHLSEGQRATVAAKLANMVQGQRTDIQPSANLQKVSQTDAAHMLNVSARSVASAAKVLHSGDEELVHAVERGEVAVSAAAKVADLPKETQRAIVNEGASKVREVAKAARHAGKPQSGPKAEAFREELKAAQERGVSMLETYVRLTLKVLRSQDSFTEQEHSLLAELMDVIAASTAESAKP